MEHLSTQSRHRTHSATVSPSPRDIMSASPSLRGLSSMSGLKSETMSRNLEDNMQLQQARWAEHRKKIGLRKSNKMSSSNMVQNTYDRMKSELVEFTEATFQRKECVRFVPKQDSKRKPGDPIKCCCGELPENHVREAAGVKNFFSKGAEVAMKELAEGEDKPVWNAKTDIREMTTNAYGKVDFNYEGLGGRKASKYLRLQNDTPIESVLELFNTHWHMRSPHPANLVITVIGGAKNFKLDGKKKEIFNRGLVNAAQTTHAWIITSGCHMGVMRAVGEAVADAQSYTWDNNGLVHTLRCIGIAPWGYVLDRQAMVAKDTKGSWNATYKPSKIIRHGCPVSLNPNHTHFLLVDDGHRGRYDGVAEFRARLERKLSLPSNPAEGEEAGCGIPVVLVVVEGGFDAINDVHRSIKARIPCVICEGTGRAADILAYAYTHFVTKRDGQRVMKDNHKMVLENKLVNAYGKTWEARSNLETETAKCMTTVMECCQDENLMTVFDMNKNEELDLAILSALLKGQAAKNLDQIRDQLKLALTWNRTDVAEEDIFTLDVVWPTGSLNDIMTEAIVDDKVGFVRLLLQNGVCMDEYLTPPMLRVLYNKIPRMCHLSKLLQAQSKYDVITLRDVSKLLGTLLGRFRHRVYEADRDHKAVERKMDCAIQVEDADDDRIVIESKKRLDKFENPFRELFLWAVLVNRQDMAKFLWERGEEALPSAIAASKIHDSLGSNLAHYESDLKESYRANKDEFENLAVRVLDECNNADPEKAAMLIERKYSSWGAMDCLEMAAQAEDKHFLSTICCQNSLNLIWKRGIASHSFLVVLALLFPPLIFCVIKFQSLGQGSDRLTPGQKFVTFFKAPCTKFFANLIMYLAFLFLYSYMILFSYRPQMTMIEWLVTAWTMALIMEEIREMFFNSMNDSVKQALRLWWNFSVFNRLDLLIIILAILALVLRLIPYGPITWAKNVYAVNCIFMFVRLLREYSADSSLGPKLVMIKEMLKELILFIAILLVFLLAYGIASQALMHPVREFYPLIFRDIFYYPYWQVYGELYLEELEGRTDSCLGNGTLTAEGMPCPESSWLVIVLTVFYLLIGNLLLLNILIAIFNNVFNKIDTNSIQIWKYGMYFLVVEYDNKPMLAPPFVVIEHLFLFIRWVCRRTCCKVQMQEDQYSNKHVEMLELFEREMVRVCVHHYNQMSKDGMQTHVQHIHHRVDEMAKLLEEERLLEQQHFEAEQNKLAEKENALKTSKLSTTSSPRPLVPQMSTSSSEASLSAVMVASAGAGNHGNKASDGQRKYSRWPSMDKIRQLMKKELQSIPEAPRARYSQPDATPPLIAVTEADTAYRAPGPALPKSVEASEPNIAFGEAFSPSHDRRDGNDDDDERQELKRSEKRSSRRRAKHKRREDRSSSHPRGYERLAEETSSEGGNPVSRQVMDTLHGMQHRMEALESSTQTALKNIESLLQAVVSQNPPQQALDPRHRYSTQVYGDYDTTQRPVSAPFNTHTTVLPGPPSGEYMRTQNALVDLPPTYPPMRQFQSFDDLI